jgi:hypothetical protein
VGGRLSSDNRGLVAPPAVPEVIGATAKVRPVLNAAPRPNSVDERMEGNMTRGECRKEAEGRRKDLLWSSVLTLTIIGLSQRAGAQATSPVEKRANLRITLRIYNHAISRDLLAHSEGEAGSILRRAGLEVNWVDCPLSVAELESHPACQAPMGRADFSVKILTAKEAQQLSKRRGVLGRALECPGDGVGCSVYLFYRDVTELARETGASEAQLLGHALAHEIGHLLLGPNSHAASGVMRSNWQEQEMQAISRSFLLFTDQQSRLMQDEVSARNRTRKTN